MNDFISLFFFVGFIGLLIKHYLYPWYRRNFIMEGLDLENMTAMELLVFVAESVNTSGNYLTLKLSDGEETAVFLLDAMTESDYDTMLSEEKENKTIH